MDDRRTHNTVHAVATEYILDMYKIQNKVYINLQEKLILSVLSSNLWERIIMRKYKIKIPKHKKLSPVLKDSLQSHVKCSSKYEEEEK